MRTLSEITKGRDILYVEGEMTVYEAVQYMTEHKIGAVPVIMDGKVSGIFSERDLMHRIVAQKCDPSSTKVKDVMTKELIVLESNDSYDHAVSVMKKMNIRHVPVREGDKLLGMISMRDLMETTVEDRDEEIDFLKQYIYFRP